MAFIEREQDQMTRLFDSICFANSDQDRKRSITKRALLVAQLKQSGKIK